MKYVALLSGGKDSCYNLLHCHKNGHELVAAASLGPEQGKEEIDSYLYQTVGQDAIEFVARALEVPLYRRVIAGDAVEQGSEYGGRNPKDAGGVEGDETEDLYALLSSVKSHHPDIQGVSVGAILSNYQRVRVEHVCRRLSLTSLSYLWQRDQGDLFTEMIEAGMEAILIKVAGIGLTTKHLGKTLAEMQPTLVKLNSMYGAHICGEGGEYETLTLDCPLFKHKIILREVETVIHSDNSFATVAYLRIKNAVLEQKTNVPVFDIAVPPTLEEESISIRNTVSEHNIHAADGIPSVRVLTSTTEDVESFKIPASRKALDSWVSITNIQRDISDNSADLSIEQEVRECFQKLQDTLAEYSLNLSHCTNINIFLSSIDLFARVNAVYATFFGASPPARACVAVDLPSPIHVKLDCTAFSEHLTADRQALHVQSLSYWAPANIGPYSQAITVNERVFISGQIGLIPSSLTLPSPPSLAIETALCFQHVEKIADALRNSSGGGWTGHCQSTIYWLANVGDIPSVRAAHATHEEHTNVSSPTLFLAVKSLPKDALVEKQVMLHTGRHMVADEDDDEPVSQYQKHKYHAGGATGSAQDNLYYEVSQFDHGDACTIICVRNGDVHAISSILKADEVLNKIWSKALSIRLFHLPSRASSFSSLANDLFDESCPPTTTIPCRFIATKESYDWDYAMCILGT